MNRQRVGIECVGGWIERPSVHGDGEERQPISIQHQGLGRCGATLDLHGCCHAHRLAVELEIERNLGDPIGRGRVVLQINDARFGSFHCVVPKAN